MSAVVDWIDNLTSKALHYLLAEIVNVIQFYMEI